MFNFHNLNDIEFVYNGNIYRLEFWKGDYFNMGMGAEIGFYKGSSANKLLAPLFHFDAVNEDEFLKMSFSLYDRSNITDNSNSGNLIFNRYLQDHWWLTGFKPDAPKVKAEELYMVGEISFPTELMKQKFIEAFDNKKEKDKKGMTIRVSTVDPTKIYFNWKTN